MHTEKRMIISIPLAILLHRGCVQTTSSQMKKQSSSRALDCPFSDTIPSSSPHSIHFPCNWLLILTSHL